MSDLLDRTFLKLMNTESPDLKYRTQFFLFASQIMLTTLIDLLRGPHRRKQLFPDVGDPRASIEAMPDQEKEQSEAALSSLTDACWRLWRRTFHLSIEKS